jgi:hypothetical protein
MTPLFLFPTLIPLSGVDTTCFSSCCDKDSAIIFTTGHLLDVNPHALFPKGLQRRLRYSSETPTFFQNYLAMRNTADVTGGNSIAVRLQSISGLIAVNPFVAFYDIHGRKREVLFIYFVPDTTRDRSQQLSRYKNSSVSYIFKQILINVSTELTK